MSAYKTAFKKVGFDEIKEYREQYFSSLYEAQELFLEWEVLKSGHYVIETEKVIGYFSVSPENVMVEFFLEESSIQHCEEIFDEILSAFNVKKAYCKSFDSLLLKCCLKSAFSHKVIGTLFRDFEDTKEDFGKKFMIKTARDEDIPALLLQHDELYGSEEELDFLVKNNSIDMYYSEKQWVGCGFLIEILSGQKYYDIGMWVKTEYRNRGFAAGIIAHLKADCLKKGRVPICGCAADNIASRRTLEKNGFFSRHDLIEFRF